MMRKITREEQVKQIRDVEKYQIYGWYHLQELEKEIRKGNETIRVLFDLLNKEINKHNGQISKKRNKIRNTPTID